MVGIFVIIPYLLVQFLTKGLHYYGYSMYRPIFKSFLTKVYPVAVTKYCYRSFQKFRITPLFFIQTVQTLDCKHAKLCSYSPPNVKKND